MKLYYRFFLIHLKCVFQYKVSFLLLAVGQFSTSFSVLIGILFMYQRFHVVKDYLLGEVILCYSIVLMGFTLAEVFVRGFDVFAHTIANGEFDRILLRPRNEIFLILAGKIEIARVGRLAMAVAMLAYGVSISKISWSADKILILVLMILGGSFIFGSLLIVFASLCFFTLEGLEFMNVLTDGAREYGKYPIDIYGRKVLRFCTYAVPYTLFQYYPFLYLTGRADNKLYILLPVIACLFVIPSGIFWRFGVKHYKSTGS